MPPHAFEALQNAVAAGAITTNADRLETALLAQLRRMTPEEIAALPQISEGLENRIFHASRTANSYEQLLSDAKTRRYPMARLRRVLWTALLDMTHEDTTGLPPYIRVLGMNARGREILSAARPSLPLLTRAAQVTDLDSRAQRVFSLECIATDLHGLAMPSPVPCGTDYTQKMILA